MSTVVAAPAVSPLPPSAMEREVSPKTYPHLAIPNPSTAGARSHETSPKAGKDGKTSPRAYASAAVPGPCRYMIVVKTEPAASPELSSARHRPRKLDLSKNSTINPPAAARTASGNPLTGLHDVGLACLSPGFFTQDPAMRDNIQRSISVRNQQQHIIESRLQRSAKPTDPDAGRRGEMNGSAGPKTPSARRKAPPGLSIVAPPHQQFANERVIQSAPLRPSFSARPHPSASLADSSHIHHVPATQTKNRLPPITDVFAGEGFGVAPRDGPRTGYFPPHSHMSSHSSHSASRPTFPSPGQAPTAPGPAPLPPTAPGPGPAPAAAPSPAERPREYRSADEAVASLSGGREDLIPKIVHYGGHQPPTPPSPMTAGPTPHRMPPHPSAYAGPDAPRLSTSGPRRRGRGEYEREMGSPPLGHGPDPRRAPFGEGRDSPEAQRRKKDEFLGLCSRAWDLFHS
ncbi:MAG: hypothetical protein M1826_004081 [Phylliscum demangeonii]|nr:MAG: hypothetical protein M1826_004081 [Phylliscum demangeonii]